MSPFARLKTRIGTGILSNLSRGLKPALSRNYEEMLSLLAAIILLSVLLSGCSSATSVIPSIYLTSLSYQNLSPTVDPIQVNGNISQTFAALVDNTALEVRAGYFGLCVSYAGGKWECGNNATALASRFQPNQDPLNLIWASAKIKDEIVFSGFLILAIILALVPLCGFATFPDWHEEFTDDDDSIVERRAFPSRLLLRIMLASTALASFFSLISMIWQHTAAVTSATTTQDLAYGSVKGDVGTVAMALGWAGLASLVLPSIALYIFHDSLTKLDLLTDE